MPTPPPELFRSAVFRVWIPERADLYRTSFAERAGIDDQLGRGRKYGRTMGQKLN